MSGEVWNVMTLKDGNVSLLKNLSEDECRAVVQRINGGDPWSQDAIYNKVLSSLGRYENRLQAAASGGFIVYHDVSFDTGGWGVDRCEWWGSAGGKLEIWPEPPDYADRLAEAERVADVVKSTNSEIDARLAA